MPLKTPSIDLGQQQNDHETEPAPVDWSALSNVQHTCTRTIWRATESVWRGWCVVVPAVAFRWGAPASHLPAAGHRVEVQPGTIVPSTGHRRLRLRLRLRLRFRLGPGFATGLIRAQRRGCCSTVGAAATAAADECCGSSWHVGKPARPLERRQLTLHRRDEALCAPLPGVDYTT